MQLLFIFKLFGIPFFSYTTLTITGIVLALIAAAHQVRRAGGEPRWVAQAFVWVVPAALLGGRLVHIVTNWSYFAERPANMLRFADGGMAFVGVFCAGTLGFWLWTRRQHIAFWHAADCAAMPLTLLAACAWLGAFMHGSQYGAPVENALALELRDAFGVIVARWPTPLLASAWSALTGLGLLAHSVAARRQRTRRLHALQFAWFLSVYGLGMFWLDFTRGDASLYILGFRLSQCLYLVWILVGILHIGRSHSRA